MALLNNIPEEFLKPLLPCFDLLKNCNIVFFDDRSFIRKMLPYFYIITCVVLYQISLTIYLFEGFKNGMDIDELVYVVPVYVVCTQTLFKAAIVISKMTDIESIILRMGALWRTQELSEVQISKKNVMLKRLKFCYAAFYWMNILGSWQYILTPLFETIVRKYILQQECVLMLPFGCYFPFDVEKWGIYLCAYLFEAYSMFRIVYWYLGTEFLMIIMSSHLGTEFILLQEDLLHYKPRYSKRNDITYIQEPLRNLIRRHQILIGLTEDLDKIFNQMIFVNLSSASISICFFGFSAKVAQDFISRINNFVPVLVLMLPIYNLCYYGELLKEASEGVANAAYTSLWYMGDKTYKKAIWFLIRRSHKPCTLSSLKYNPIALSTFTTVISTTWSYFSLASSVYDDSANLRK